MLRVCLIVTWNPFHRSRFTGAMVVRVAVSDLYGISVL